jgi:hypothetical protein
LSNYVKATLALPAASRGAHRDIDARLPTLQGERKRLRNLPQTVESELIADGHTGFEQVGNWRLRIDSSGDPPIEDPPSATVVADRRSADC